MKKMNLVALLLGAALFLGFGVTNASAAMKCGPGKCGSAMMDKSGKNGKNCTSCKGDKKASKSCGAKDCKCGKKCKGDTCKCSGKASKKAMKCGAGKCGNAMMGKAGKNGKNCTSCKGNQKASKGCGMKDCKCPKCEGATCKCSNKTSKKAMKCGAGKCGNKK